MAKMNFTKIEEVFDEGLRKAKVSQLIGAADASANPESQASEAEAGARRQLLTALKHELKYLQKAGHEPYEKVHLSREELKQFMENPSTITKETWERIVKIKEEVEHLKKEAQATTATEDIVEKERHKHVNKRFNVNEKWLPLK